MNTKTAMVGILTVATLAFATDSALARKMDYVPPGRAKSLCVADGGIWVGQNSRGVYGCVNDDGSHGFACGGDTASTRHTCGSW
jgi:hypothetical protein